MAREDKRVIKIRLLGNFNVPSELLDAFIDCSLEHICGAECDCYLCPARIDCIDWWDKNIGELTYDERYLWLDWKEKLKEFRRKKYG